MSDADDILARMQHVRRDVGDDVHDLVTTAKKLSDWRYHVRSHPWACLGAAFAAGYFVIPKRRKPTSNQTKELLALLKKHNIGIPQTSSQTRKGLAGALFTAAMPIVMRTGMSLINQRLLASSNSARSVHASPQTPNET